MWIGISIEAGAMAGWPVVFALLLKLLRAPTTAPSLTTLHLYMGRLSQHGAFFPSQAQLTQRGL
jgi:hypothetical protein